MWGGIGSEPIKATHRLIGINYKLWFAYALSSQTVHTNYLKSTGDNSLNKTSVC